METVELVAKILGVVGFCLAIYNIWWDRRKFSLLRQERLDDKEERRKEKEQEAKAKEEQSRERVKAELSLGRTDGGLIYTLECRLRVYNPCSFTIPIKYVWLIYLDLEQTKEPSKPVTTSIPLYAELIAESPVAGRNVASSKVRLGSSTGFELKTRQEVFFSYNHYCPVETLQASCKFLPRFIL